MGGIDMPDNDKPQPDDSEWGEWTSQPPKKVRTAPLRPTEPPYPPPGWGHWQCLNFNDGNDDKIKRFRWWIRLGCMDESISYGWSKAISITKISANAATVPLRSLRVLWPPQSRKLVARGFWPTSKDSSCESVPGRGTAEGKNRKGGREGRGGRWGRGRRKKEEEKLAQQQGRVREEASGPAPLRVVLHL